MSTRADELINEYLDRLEEELADFPSSRRRELVQEISDHIAEARVSLEREDEASIRNLLERIGDPAEIASEAGAAPEPDPVVAASETSVSAAVVEERHAGAVEIGALILLLIGGLILPVVGWIIGVILLWVSSAWTVPQKLLGTLVVPGGLALPLGIGLLATSSASCIQVPVAGAPNPIACTSGGSGGQMVGTVVVIALAAASVATVAYLARRMFRNEVAVPA
jgi:uncharacterized membrane protein